MQRSIFICIIGDFNPKYQLHNDTNLSFSYAAQRLGVELKLNWVNTASLTEKPEEKLEKYDAFLCAPGSPYESMQGALNGIKFARESDRPFLGTCGGFQHAIIEYARNVCGIKDAQHAEENPDAPHLLVTRLACSLAGKTQRIQITRGTRAYQVYSKPETEERFFCNFGLNPIYRKKMESSGLEFSGFDENGDVRIIELPKKKFYFGTLFVPQACPTEYNPHPLIAGLVQAAIKSQK